MDFKQKKMNNNSIKNIFEKIVKNITEPFFVLNGKGEILHSNEQAKTLFNLLEVPGKLIDYLENGDQQKFEDLLDTLVEKDEPLQIEHFDIEIKNNKKITSQLILNTYEEKKKLYILCTIIPRSYTAAFTGKDKIQVNFASRTEVISNKKIEQIVEKIESLYPLTLIGKEVTHKLVNELDEFFWIVDNTGKFLVVNNYFAKTLGLKPFQMEGKYFNEFIPGYIKSFYDSIESFLTQTLNCIVLEGVPFGEMDELSGKEIIELPLVDSENNLFARIGFSQRKGEKSSPETKDERFDILFKIIDNFPKAVAFITSDGYFKHYGDEFSKLFPHEPKEINGLKFEELLSGSFAEKVRNFIESPEYKKELYLNDNFEVEKFGKKYYKVYLTKYFISKNQLEGFSLIIEPIEFTDNLEQLIKSRGIMFEFLIQNNPEPIYIYDKENLRFLEVNQAALDLYGYSREEFLQMDLTDLYTPEDIQTLLDSSGEQTETGKFSKPFRQKKKDGSTVFVEISKMDFKYNDVDSHFNIVKDVTDKLELEKKNQLFKVAFDNTGDLIFVTDPQGIITFANLAVQKTLGLSKIELEKSTLASLVKDDDRITITTTIFQSHLKEPATINIDFKADDGELIPAELTATPILDFEGEIESFTIIGKVKSASSESEPKEVVKEVIKEVFVEKPASGLSQTPSVIDTTFLSNVFHEILTPMNVILGFSQELSEGIENLTPEQQEAVDIINQNRSKLLSTMNSIIEYSEIQKRKDEWDIQEINITELVDELDKDIYEITGSKEIKFAYGRISSSLKFESDKSKFDSLINNLIRLIGRISKDKKVYFSAYPVDNDNFIVMLSDIYAGASAELSDTLRKLFEEHRDPKELGISKLSAHITEALLKLMNGKFVSHETEAGRFETGFIFPVKYHPAAIEEEPPVEESGQPESFEEPQPRETLEKPVIEEPQQEESFEQPIVEEETENEEPFEEPVVGESREDELNPPEEDQQVEFESESEQVYEEEIPQPEDQQVPGDFENEPPAEPEAGDDLGIEIEEETVISTSPAEPEPPAEEFHEEPPSIFEGGEQPVEEHIDFLEPEGPVESSEEIIQAEEEFVPKEEQIEPEIKSGETIPFEEPPAEQQFLESGDKFDISNLTCLYIEDQVDSQILFKVQMKGLKDIKYAVSFEEALPLLESENFDFIVMDINLQGEYNGLDALKIIHKMPDYQDVPIIAVTAYVLPGDKEKFIATGFDDFISKPIFREKMVESLKKIFLQNA